MANQEHLARLLHSIRKWNQWRRERPEIEPDLSEADLSSLRLNEANFLNANLSSALLTSSDLSQADLSNANLHGVNLFNANFSYAILTKTSLHEASMWGTILSNTDLSTTRGLVSINHQGPSCIELHTVTLPLDGSMQVFLRGAGVPEEWIEDYGIRMLSPIQYHSCFISYAHRDQDLAQRLHADLQSNGVRCWFAPHDLRIGDKIRPRIDESIRLYDKLLLILSQHSVESQWVEHEVEMALAKERRETRTVLFPIRLDATLFERDQDGWPAEVRHTRHIGDFSGWKHHDIYQQAFERLLRDLQASSNTDSCG